MRAKNSREKRVTISTLFRALAMGAPGAETKSRDNVNGIIVSTVITPDMGWETALVDKNGAHPVERYETEEQAEAGHKKWMALARTGTKVLKLGYGDVVDDVEITLDRCALN